MNKRLDIRMFVLAATIALLTASCAQEPGGGDVRAAIEAQAAKWEESFNAGDGDRSTTRIGSKEQIARSIAESNTGGSDG